MIKIIKISGSSLFPEYRDGDFVILTKIPVFFNQFSPGDVVVFQHELYGMMIKRVARVDRQAKKLFLLGDHDASLDSRQFGWIENQRVVGKVIRLIAQKQQNTL